jgi:hypothetical protein
MNPNGIHFEPYAVLASLSVGGGFEQLQALLADLSDLLSSAEPSLSKDCVVNMRVFVKIARADESAFLRASFLVTMKR